MTTATERPRGFSAWLDSVYRLPQQGMCGGVIAGLSDYYGWNVRLVRVLTVIATLTFLGAISLCVYGVLWYVLEPRRSDGEPITDDDRGAFPFTGRRARRRAARQQAEQLKPVKPTVLRKRFDAIDQRLRSLEACVTNRDFHLKREIQRLEREPGAPA